MRHALILLALVPAAAAADPRTDCPSPQPCKVITLTAEEEQALFGPKMVFDTAVAGRQIDLFGVASYFRSKVAAAPAGDVHSAGESQPGVTVNGNAPPAAVGPPESSGAK
jgi:hypothetical protein